ncbi:hypothetical protein [Streptomyces alkaliphilus]|uniref:hypothetical protein n=1 Tax=Streptomyces alkaliphilus TaxID=1472722 RepID=UPI0015FDF21E|nr:hypothetical protein [Streptomyces alkaliphilus]
MGFPFAGDGWESGDDPVRVEVWDGRPDRLPVTRQPGPAARAGRGVGPVAALAERRGVTVAAVAGVPTKTVGCE